MLTTVLVTISGPDRPGLVEAIATRVRARGGNWLESRLLHLGGCFAGIVRIEVEAATRDALVAALQSPVIPGLQITVQPLEEMAGGASGQPPLPAALRVLEVVGHDRPGIIRELSRVLAMHGVNVEELATERSSAPMSGEPIFQARATVRLPASLDLADLRRELEKIAGDLMVDLRISGG